MATKSWFHFNGAVGELGAKRARGQFVFITNGTILEINSIVRCERFSTGHYIVLRVRVTGYWLWLGL